MARRAAYIIAILSSLGILSCGGGGASQDLTGPTPLNRQVLVSPESADTFGRISDHGGKLYVTSNDAIVEVDPATSSVRTIVGNSQMDSPQGLAPTIFAPPVAFGDDNNVYAPTEDYSAYRMSAISLDPNLAAIDVLVPQQGCLNFKGIAADSGRTAWFCYVPGAEQVQVFTQLHRQGASRKLAGTVNGRFFRAVLKGNLLYIQTHDSSTLLHRVYRLRLDSGQSELVAQYQATLESADYYPIAKAPSGVYWAFEGQVYFASDASTSLPAVVASVDGMVRDLAVSGDSLIVVHGAYASQYPSNLPLLVSKVDPTTGSGTELFRREQDLTPSHALAIADDGRPYWAEHSYRQDAFGGSWVYAISPSGLTPLFHAPSGNGGITGLEATASKVAVSYQISPAISVYDVATQAVSVVHPMYSTDHLAHFGETLVFASVTGARIDSLRVDQRLNEPVVLVRGNAPDVLSFRATAQANGYLYQIGPVVSNDHGMSLSRSRTDGSEYSELLSLNADSGSSELVIHDGRVWFLCRDACGTAGFSVVSVPIAGGSLRHDADLGNAQIAHLFEYGGHGYVTLSNGGHTRILAFDFSSLSSAELVADVPFGDVALTFSGKWLTWTGENYSPAYWSYSIGRHSWISWDKVGPLVAVESSSGSDLASMMSPAHSVNGKLYFWHNGLIQVDE